MSRSMIKQKNSGATAHVVLYTPRQSTTSEVDSCADCLPIIILSKTLPKTLLRAIAL